MWRTTPHQPADRRLRQVVTGVALLGAVSIGAAGADVLGVIGDPVPAPGWPPLTAYLLLLIGGAFLRVRVRTKSTWHGVIWTDTVILVGLAALPAGWVILATPVGILFARLAKRSSPIKTTFAVAKETTIALTGGLVLALLAGPWPVGLVVAFAAMTVVDLLLVIPVLALASRTTFGARLRAHPDLWPLALVGRLGAALLAVLVLREQPHLVYALPLLVLLGHVWQDQWVRTREERRAWQRFAGTTDGFAGLDLDGLLRRAATGGAELFSAEVCEVELSALARVVRSGGDGITFDGDPADAPPDLERSCVHGVSLHGGPGQPEVGVLRLRFREPVRLSEREQAMLASYASALETAIRDVVAQPVGDP